MRAAPAQFYELTRSARKIIVVDLGFLGNSSSRSRALGNQTPLSRGGAPHFVRRHRRGIAQPRSLRGQGVGVSLDAAKSVLVAALEHYWRAPPRNLTIWPSISAVQTARFSLTALTGAKWRLAHEGGRKHFWNRWLIPNWVARQSQEIPVFEQRRRRPSPPPVFRWTRRVLILRIPVKARESVCGEHPGQLHSPVHQRQ